MTKIYRDFDQVQLDIEYNARGTVPDYTIFGRENDAYSEEARLSLECMLDMSYGDHPDEVIDIFPAGPKAPVFLYFHGGYWRANSQKQAAAMAPNFVKHGITVIPVNYSLAPGASLDEIIRQSREAVAWVWKYGAEEFGAHTDRIFIGGTSAGGHITGMVLAGGWHDEFGVPAKCVIGALALNGLYDLEPVRLSEPNEWAQLDEAAAYRNSPIYQLPEHGCPLIVSFGGSETSEFKRQSKIYAAAWRDRGWPCSEFEVTECNHFNIPQQLRDPATRLCREVFEMIGV
ncbi:MAG: alpha/beta hydrolase [Pseudomonadota bacterium]|nr:alpha/beta hydrolase [Pseudomonadota bacterium]